MVVVTKNEEAERGVTAFSNGAMAAKLIWRADRSARPIWMDVEALET